MANAVYLIIAGALLGPIQAQKTAQEPVDCTHSKSGMICTTKAVYEETTETCARALREIGAEQGQWIYPDNITTRGAPLFVSGSGPGWFLERNRVLCIPAPSGIVK